MVLNFTHKISSMEDFKLMKRKFIFATKCILFLLLLILILSAVNNVLVPKYFIDNSWPTTSTYLGFYEMPENSIDVLFLGSSHGVTAFIPQELYNNYGITSYNLSCEQQNLVISYYWLKEALRFQKPKAVVLETFYLFNDQFDSSEAYMRKAMDYMKWSSVKRQAINDICTIDTTQSKSSYYFTNQRFHTRWRELSENDFSYPQMSKHYELKGFSTKFDQINENDYVPLSVAESSESANTVELMQLYLEKISTLCAENNIELILVKNPTTSQTVKKYNATKELANELHLAFYDFNTAKLYNDIGFSFAEDMIDRGHASLKGAMKITNYLGGILQEDYGIAPQVNEVWENTRYTYSCLQFNSNLKHIPDINTYLNCLKLMKEHYSVFIVLKNDGICCPDETVINSFNELGLSYDLPQSANTSYVAVITPKKVFENVGTAPLEAKGTIRNGIVRYQITSGSSAQKQSSCSIQLDGTEYAKNYRGLNIVVYDNLTKKVIDSVSFDTDSTEMLSLR